MPDVGTEVAAGAKAPIMWTKEHPIVMIFLILLIALLAMHLAGRVQSYVVVKATGRTSGAWHRLGKFIGAPVGILVVLTGLHFLGCDVGGILAQLFGVGTLLAIVAFPQSDFAALKDESGNFTSFLTPGSTIKQRKFIFAAQRETWGGAPIKATDVQLAVSAVLTPGQQAGSPIPWDALANLLYGLEIYSPRFGTMAAKESLSGPVLKHMYEFITRGYRYSGDEIFSIVKFGEGPAPLVTYYFNYPLMNRCMAKSDESAWFVGWLQKTEFRWYLNVATILSDLGISVDTTMAGNDVSLRCGYRYITGVQQGDPRDAYAIPAIPYAEVIKQPAQGQIDIPFVGIGGTGPQNCDISEGVRLLAMVYLSNVLGMPGAGPVNDIVEIGCEALGILPTESVDMFLAAKLERLGPHGGGIGTEAVNPYISHQCWPWTLQHNDSSLGLLGDTDLLGMPLYLPAAEGQKMSKLLRVKGDITVHARRNSPPTGSGLQHCLYVQTYRDVEGSYAAQMLKDAGVAASTLNRAVNHNANAAVASGARHRGNYVGTPIKAT